MTPEQREATAAALATLNTANLCGVYVKLRDAKAAAEAELAKRLTGTKLAMETIEGLLLARLAEQDIDSVATPSGTAYRKTLANYSVKDKDVFLNWALTNGVPHVLDVRAAKAAVEEVVQETGELPPGVFRSAIFKVGIRRSPNQ